MGSCTNNTLSIGVKKLAATSTLSAENVEFHRGMRELGKRELLRGTRHRGGTLGGCEKVRTRTSKSRGSPVSLQNVNGGASGGKEGGSREGFWEGLTIYGTISRHPIKGGGRTETFEKRWMVCNEEGKVASTCWRECGECENGRDRIKNQNSAFWSVWKVQPPAGKTPKQ